MKLIYLALLFISFSFISASQAQTDKEYQQRLIKINRAMEDFSKAYTLLLDYHIASVDPELIIDAAIRGMTNSLDPYTELLNESQSETFEVLTTNQYIGIGIVTDFRDSMITIVEVADFSPARKSGLRVGDRIMKINETYVLNSKDDESRNLLKGNLGSSIDLTILRGDRTLDTLQVSVSRESIAQQSLSYHELIHDTIAYIQIKDFSADTKREFKEAFLEMQNASENKLKGLIIDLRGNGGGIMLSAVDLFELFVPLGTSFGTIKNRQNSSNPIYTRNSPIDLETPIAIIVNSFSASASEFLAASLQDVGRAIIVGEKTFGKGISQIIRDLPSGKSLKITIDKYYTPLGRAINTVDIRPEYIKDTSSLPIDTVFTKFGKKLYSNSAVTPDTIIEAKEFTPYLMELINKDAFFHYANELSAKNISISLNSEPSDAMMSEFKQYADSLLSGSSSEMEKAVKSIQDIFDNGEMSESLLNNFNALKQGISDYYAIGFQKNFEDIRSILAIEILKRYHPNSVVYSYILKRDRFKTAAILGLFDNNYNRILAKNPIDGKK